MRMSREGRVVCLTLIAAAIVSAAFFSDAHTAVRSAQSFTMEQIKSYPFPNELTASATGSRIAWAFNERGVAKRLGRGRA